MDFLLIVGIVILVGVLGFSVLKSKSTERNFGKIESKYATLSDVKECLGNFEPEQSEKLKNGYTEKSIENQLAKHLKTKFLEVTQQYGIEGKNPRAIDIDVAAGTAGIELKDAKSVVKTAEMDRVKSQIIDYQEKRYKTGNLFLIVCGKEEDATNSMLVELKEYCKDKGVIYMYSTVK